MTLSVSFSGGLSHDKDIPEDRQSVIAERILHTVRAAVQANGGSGGLSVTVGRITKTATATSVVPAD
jgi:hypothetical protein